LFSLYNDLLLTSSCISISQAEQATGLMPDTQTTVSAQNSEPVRYQNSTVYIDGAKVQITKKFFFAGDVANILEIDTSVIPDFKKKAVIERVVHGPLGLIELWNVLMLFMAYAPTLYSRRDHAMRAISQTTVEDYPSRKEVKATHCNVSLLNF